MKPIKRRREKLMFRVIKGGLAPADDFTTRRLRERGYRVNDLLAAELTKPRNPGFHRLAHQLGTLVAENIESFCGMDAHAVLKRLQWEANIGCEEMGVQVPGVGLAMVRIPRSLGYESLDQGEFHEIVAGFCRYIAQTYWKTLKPEEIERMASCYVEAA